MYSSKWSRLTVVELSVIMRSVLSDMQLHISSRIWQILLHKGADNPPATRDLLEFSCFIETRRYQLYDDHDTGTDGWCVEIHILKIWKKFGCDCWYNLFYLKNFHKFNCWHIYSFYRTVVGSDFLYTCSIYRTVAFIHCSTKFLASKL